MELTNTATITVERRFASTLWLDPVANHDSAVVLGLSTDDFEDEACAAIFSYACQSAEAGKPLDVPECARVSRQHGFTVTMDDIFDVVIGVRTDKNCHEDYALAVRNAADDRKATECRELVKDVLRRMAESISLDESRKITKNANSKPTIRVNSYPKRQTGDSDRGKRQRTRRYQRTYDARIA